MPVCRYVDGPLIGTVYGTIAFFFGVADRANLIDFSIDAENAHGPRSHPPCSPRARLARVAGVMDTGC